MHQIIDKIIPHKMTSSRYNLPWFGRPLRQLCRKKQRRFNMAKASQRTADWNNYNNNFKKCVQRNSVPLKRITLLTSWLAEAFKDNPSVFWRYIKNLSILSNISHLSTFVRIGILYVLGRNSRRLTPQRWADLVTAVPKPNSCINNLRVSSH